VAWPTTYESFSTAEAQKIAFQTLVLRLVAKLQTASTQFQAAGAHCGEAAAALWKDQKHNLRAVNPSQKGGLHTSRAAGVSVAEHLQCVSHSQKRVLMCRRVAVKNELDVAGHNVAAAVESHAEAGHIQTAAQSLAAVDHIQTAALSLAVEQPAAHSLAAVEHIHPAALPLAAAECIHTAALPCVVVAQQPPVAVLV
jgi:hypothetical protein